MTASSPNAVPLGPASRDRKARMRAMTDAAIALFSEEGYSAVSTRRIAERAGCSETLLFRYFGDKRGLLMAICNQLREDPGRVHPSLDELPDDVQTFIEDYLLETFANFKRQAPTLKVVIAAFINDSEMTADFEVEHDAAVEYVASALRQYQGAGAIASTVDIDSISSAIEQLGFAVGFLLQLVFERPQRELTAIATTSAATLSQGMAVGGSAAATTRRARRTS